MASYIANAHAAQAENAPLVSATALLAPMAPRPYQVDAATALDHAIWNEQGNALAAAPVAAGKSLTLIMVAHLGLKRGCKRVLIISRAGHIARHSLDILASYALHLGEPLSGGLYTGGKKQDAQIIFATVQTLARHLDVVKGADLVLIDEADQAYQRDTGKEYSSVLKAIRDDAGCGGTTGSPFVLEKGRTIPIFGPGKVFNAPCHILPKSTLRDLGHFHFIEPAPVAPARCLKIDRKMKIDPSGDFDTRKQSTRDIAAASLPSHIMLRRVFDTHWQKIIIAVVGYVRDDEENTFDSKPVISQEWLRQRAADREAGYGHGSSGAEVQF